MIKKIILTFFTRFFIALSGLLIAVLLSKYLGAAGRGDQSLIITLITFIIIITNIIGSSSIAYLLPRFPFITLIIPSYLWATIIIILCFWILPYLNLIPQIYIPDVCILSFLLTISNININVLISKQRINEANILNFVQSLISVLVILIFFLFLRSPGIHSYLISLYIGYSITLLLSFILTGKYFSGLRLKSIFIHLEALKKLVTLGFFNQAAVFLQLLSFRLSYYVLNAQIGKEEVGIYSNAVSIAESVWLIGRSIAVVQHSKIVNSNDNKYSISITTLLNKINFLISFLLLIILSIIPGSWYLLIFGNEFVNINKIIWTMAPGILFFGVALILGYYFSSTGKHYINTISSAAGFLITLVMSFILIPLYNSYGAAVTASISYGVSALIIVIFFIREKNRVK